ncbi:LysR family transcriptional regulator [Sphingobium sp. EM0848]|uniref:LysR family transcriptional regulator n=1 Tax=Sphingobium sp. EM0848 TaxID=2743473 RepID=UPI00159C66BC|nr:LysR family transcriptional regulator [Sphingobium sp. EM0848]
MDRLDAMQVLLAVVDAGSLSAGSRALKMPLPSVSRKVAELERHLGTHLVIRTSRNLQLTDAGRDYVEAARQIVAQVREAELRASGEYEVPRGLLTLTVPMAFGRLHVLPFAYQFLSEYPEITLNILSLDRMVQLVEERVDVGVRLGELADSSLLAIKVGQFRMLTCASPAYLARMGCPASPEELAGHDGVNFAPLHDTAWIYRYDGRMVHGNPRIRVCANTTANAAAAAVEGLGILRAPSYQVSQELQSGALVPILNACDSKTFPVHLIYARQGLLPLKIRVFLDWMTPQLRKALKEIGDLEPAVETRQPSEAAND